MVDGPIALTLREPARGDLWGAGVLGRSGLEVLKDLVEERLPAPPVARLTGLRLSEAGIGTASATMPASPWWQSGAGVFLAGTSAFVADLALSCAVLASAAPGVLVASSQLTVSFLRPATIRSGALIARGRLIHATRSLGLAEGLIEDARGHLLGHATSRCVFIPGEPSALPVRSSAPAPSGTRDPYLRDVEGDVLGQEFWDTTPGLDAVGRFATNALRPPVSLLFDWRGVDSREGTFAMAMPTSPWLCNAFGVVYGGALAIFADVAMTLAVGSTVPAATAYSPLDMTLHFLRPVLPGTGDLVARGHVLHRGRRIAVTTCEIVDAKGRLVARASGSVLVLPGRPWERPVHVADEITKETLSP